MASIHEVMDINARSNPKQKATPKKLRELTLSHAENDGHIVEHRFHNNNGPYHEPETHVFGKGEGKKMLAHVAEHLGIQTGKAEEKSVEKAGGAAAAEV